MQATAKVFSTGHSQAVRLPKAFRVNASEMWISKNEVTGEITLKPIVNAESKLDTLFRLLKENPLPDDFLQTRTYAPPRDPFAEVDESTNVKKPTQGK
jgi:antitoxin VapB